MMRLIPSLCVLALSCASLPANATTQSQCRMLGEFEVVALFDEWNDRLQAGNPGKVAELYMEEALLLPTLSADLRHSRRAHIEYFEGFLRDRPKGELTDAYVFTGCDQATLAGAYTFTFAATGKQVPARFTFNYQRVGDKWLISHHHSSLQPSKH
jgi:uncharacterized protein (TIGR02246 family)